MNEKTRRKLRQQHEQINSEFFRLNPKVEDLPNYNNNSSGYYTQYATNINNRAIKKNCLGLVTGKDIQAVLKPGQCNFCGAKQNLQIDHIIALCKQGDNLPYNLQLLCQTCNLKKMQEVDTK